MLAAAIDLWLLPTTLFLDAFFPRAKPVAACIPAPVPAEAISPTPAAQPNPTKSKAKRSKQAGKVGARGQTRTTEGF
jgi:hypothetical protein